MDCQAVEELLPAYALDALGEEEAARVEAHVKACPWCRPLLRDHLQVAANLSLAAELSEPPGRLKASTLKAIRRHGRRDPGPERWRVRVGYLALGAAASVAVLVFAALIAIGVRLSLQIDDLQDENSTLMARVSQLSAEDGKLADMVVQQRSLNYIMAASDRHVLSLEGGEGPKQGMLMIAPQSGTGVLLTKGLEPSSTGMAYTVWLEMNGVPVASGQLLVDEHGWGVLTIWPDQPITLYQKVWITMEPDHGGPSTVLWGTIASR